MAEQQTNGQLFGKGGAKYSLSGLVSNKLYSEDVVGGINKVMSSAASLAGTYQADVKATAVADAKVEQDTYTQLDAYLKEGANTASNKINTAKLKYSMSMAEVTDDNQRLKMFEDYKKEVASYHKVKSLSDEEIEATGLSEANKAKLREQRAESFGKVLTAMNTTMTEAETGINAIKKAQVVRINETSYANEATDLWTALSYKPEKGEPVTNFNLPDSTNMFNKVKDIYQGDTVKAKKYMEDLTLSLIAPEITSLESNYLNGNIDATSMVLTYKDLEDKLDAYSTSTTNPSVDIKTVNLEARELLKKQKEKYLDIAIPYVKNTALNEYVNKPIESGKAPDYKQAIKATEDFYTKAGYPKAEYTDEIEKMRSEEVAYINSKKKENEAKVVYLNGGGYRGFNSIGQDPKVTAFFVKDVRSAIKDGNYTLLQDMANREPEIVGKELQPVVTGFLNQLTKASIGADGKPKPGAFKENLRMLQTYYNLTAGLPAGGIDSGVKRDIQVAYTLMDLDVANPEAVYANYYQNKNTATMPEASKQLVSNINAKTSLTQFEKTQMITDATSLSGLGLSDSVITKLLDAEYNKKTGDNIKISIKTANALGKATAGRNDVNDATIRVMDMIPDVMVETYGINKADRGKLLAIQTIKNSGKVTIDYNANYVTFKSENTPQVIVMSKNEFEGYYKTSRLRYYNSSKNKR